MKQLESARLYGILDLGYVKLDAVEEMAEQMVAGGVGIAQLRAKGRPREEILKAGRVMRPIFRRAQIPWVVNDHVDLALELEADGVHVGQDDTGVEAVRAAGPANWIVGKSTHSIEQARSAMLEKPDYIGFGPLFATPTKPDYQEIGLQNIGEVERFSEIPVFCIGGIKLENVEKVLAAGGKRVVIVSGILQAEQPAEYCRAVKMKLRDLEK